MEDKNVTRKSSQVMDLQQLIAGPLIATIEADAMSAQKYLNYVLNVAFESYDPSSGKTGKLRMLTFSYMEHDGDMAHRRTVSIPLLTLVPLPLLHIQEADFDFDIKILDAVYEKTDEKFSPEAGRAVKTENKESAFKMRASLASQHSEGKKTGELQQSLSANMKIKVKMGQADMPAGLSNILHLTANNVLIDENEDSDNVEQDKDEVR